jgi:hypothetical protein
MASLKGKTYEEIYGDKANEKRGRLKCCLVRIDEKNFLDCWRCYKLLSFCI